MLTRSSGDYSAGYIAAYLSALNASIDFIKEAKEKIKDPIATAELGLVISQIENLKKGIEVIKHGTYEVKAVNK